MTELMVTAVLAMLTVLLVVVAVSIAWANTKNEARRQQRRWRG